MKFLKLNESHLEQVMYWRTQSWVTQYMFSDLKPDIHLQKKWFERISQDDSQRYWIIIVKDKPIGVLSLNDISFIHQRCSWAFYIGEQRAAMIGMMLAPYVYNYVFEQLKFHKIIGEVMEGNDKVREMHMSYGCMEIACYHDHIYKYDQFHDVYVYEMLNEYWQQQKVKYVRQNAIFE